MAGADYTLIFSACLLGSAVISFVASGMSPGSPKRKKEHSGDGGGQKVVSTSSDSSSSSSSEQERDGVATSSKGWGSLSNDSRGAHRSLLCRYLVVYLLATLSDWLQGPYIYALYDAYGYTQRDIAVLFVAGFGSSMVLGSFVGGLADRYGRRTFVVVYSAVYAASCFTKHFNNFSVLLLGRLLGGIAYSLLFSIFDSWLIRAHADAGVDKSLLAHSFSVASHANSVVAILAGLVAHRLASANKLLPTFGGQGGARLVKGGAVVHAGGYLNPFDLAFLALCACGMAALFLWEENYGHTHQHVRGGGGSKDGTIATEVHHHHRRREDGIYESWKVATAALVGNREMLLCGAISSLFEGSMYIFIFMWTPALTDLVPSSSPSDGGSDNVDDPIEKDLPFGLIFSTFMVCSMAGASVFSLALEKKVEVEVLGAVTFATSALSMAVVIAARSDTIAFFAMNLFEFCIGMYFPIMATLKSLIVPESNRAAIYNLYRIPLNFIVLISLFTNLSVAQTFSMCTVMLGVATALQLWLLASRRRTVATTSTLPVCFSYSESDEKCL